MEVSRQLLRREPYGGREVVFLEGRPVWMAVYYGWVEGANADPERVYAFLQRALREAPAAFPVRGPDEFSEGPIHLPERAREAAWPTSRAKRAIHEGGRLVYTARYVGGSLIDDQAIE